MKLKWISDLRKIVGKSTKNKVIFALAALVLVAILLIAGVQTYLYIKFVMGHDIIVKLEADKTDISLVGGQQETVTFSIGSIANPLCRIECEYSFNDISSNKRIDSGSFATRSQLIKEISYNISNSKSGTGQDIYRIEVKCHNKKGFLCHTNEAWTRRQVLLTAERSLNEEDARLKEALRGAVEANANNFSEINSSMAAIAQEIAALNSVMNSSDIEMAGHEVEKGLAWIGTRISKEMLLWEKQNYSGLEEEVEVLNRHIEWARLGFSSLNKSVHSNTSAYNNLSTKIENAGKSFENLAAMEFNKSDVLEVEGRIREFNALAALFNENKEYKEKKNIVDKILDIEIAGFFNMSYANETTYKANESVDFEIKKIEPVNVEEYDLFRLDEPLPECCIFGKCLTCCEGKASGDSPVIFLHGHSFDKELSADYSLNVFDEIQGDLEKQGYLSAGEVSLYTRLRSKPGILGMSCMPVSVKASYYFDVLRESGDYMAIQTKSENIDTYAIRLHELVNNIKYETGQERVTIIAHSMGGLVARRYIQIFGYESVEKLILISVPNKGLTSSIRSYCSFFGAELECRDMDEKSIFINKLNSQPLPPIEIYNIYGTGCKMDEGIGDGVVLEKNAMLENAKNYAITGNCSGTSLLHGEILDFRKYPEFYKAIKDILRF